MLDITEFRVERDEKGNITILDEFESKRYLIDWEKNLVTIYDYWHDDLILTDFTIERWFELVLRKEE